MDRQTDRQIEICQDLLTLFCSTLFTSIQQYEIHCQSFIVIKASLIRLTDKNKAWADDIVGRNTETEQQFSCPGEMTAACRLCRTVHDQPCTVQPAGLLSRCSYFSPSSPAFDLYILSILLIRLCQAPLRFLPECLLAIGRWDKPRGGHDHILVPPYNPELQSSIMKK